MKLRTPTQPLGQAAAAARRHSHLAQAARLCNSSTQAACRRRRANIAAEFGEEMQLLGGSIAKANDEDTAGFFAGVWLARHTGTTLPRGDQVAAPGSLANAVSDLAAIFDQHGRNGLWISASGTGNPCHSKAVKSLVQGYNKAAFHQGFAESCAVPLTSEQLRAGLSHLARRLSQQTEGSIGKCLAARRGFMATLGWATAMRGASIGELQLPDMQHGNGQPLFDGQGNLQPLLRGESFSVKPYGLKNRQQANAGSISCTVPGERPATNVHHAWLLPPQRCC